jgi:hypothetical protein
MEMTTYAKYRILLFSLEFTDGKFLRVDNLEDGCSAIEAKAVFDESGVPPMSSMSEKVRVIACRSFRKSTRSNAEESSRMPRDSLVRRRGGHWRGWRGKRVKYNKAPDLAARSALCDQTRGRSHKPGRKPSQNEQAIFRPILAAAAAGVGAAGASVMGINFARLSQESSAERSRGIVRLSDPLVFIGIARGSFGQCPAVGIFIGLAAIRVSRRVCPIRSHGRTAHLQKCGRGRIPQMG